MRAKKNHSARVYQIKIERKEQKIIFYAIKICPISKKLIFISGFKHLLLLVVCHKEPEEEYVKKLIFEMEYNSRFGNKGEKQIEIGKILILIFNKL